MKTTTLLATAVTLAALAWPSLAPAADTGTAAEAKAMLERAVAAVKTDETAALEKFKSGAPGFKDRDLYVFCFDAGTGLFTAHPTLAGKDVKTLKDKTGKVFGDRLFAAAQKDSISTVDYMWPKPGETEPVQKETYVTKAGDQGCAVGYYK
ncbi:Methyl-accepting chemotaxis protein [Rhodovulum sp. PH10]|uniref:cache domain-containing protein n=1 Tax=Rhodovulum sp. PH10 TaxID=1187851 RepID=UPI00027C2620|nr:cache domain-containing protein [Rhodovulum sp. PH10]EJW12647.1 Methyl-accepting chemotaxis protein [Rhodovulum sp. PH10]